MKRLRNSAILFVISLLVACATSKKLNRISVGMTKEQAINLLGEPASISAKEGIEYLNYQFSETDDQAFYGITVPYYVLIKEGRVIQYGRHGDFGTTKDPTININSNSDITTTDKSRDNSTDAEKMKRELIAIKDLLDKGIISQEEYEKEKSEILNKY